MIQEVPYIERVTPFDYRLFLLSTSKVTLRYFVTFYIQYLPNPITFVSVNGLF